MSSVSSVKRRVVSIIYNLWSETTAAAAAATTAAAATSTAVVADATAAVAATASTAAVADTAAATAATAAVGSFVLRLRYKTIKEVYTTCYIIYNLRRLYFRKGLHKNVSIFYNSETIVR